MTSAPLFRFVFICFNPIFLTFFLIFCFCNPVFELHLERGYHKTQILSIAIGNVHTHIWRLKLTNRNNNANLALDLIVFMNKIQFERDEPTIVDMFRSKVGLTERRVQPLVRPTFEGNEFSADKLKIVALPDLPEGYDYKRPNLFEYLHCVRAEGHLSLDRFACSAILRDRVVLQALVHSFGGIPNTSRIIFDGTAWKTGHGINFPAIAFIGDQFYPDLWSLADFRPKNIAYRAVLVQ